MAQQTAYLQGEKHFHKDYSKGDIKHESKVNMSSSIIGLARTISLKEDAVVLIRDQAAVGAGSKHMRIGYLAYLSSSILMPYFHRAKFRCFLKMPLLSSPPKPCQVDRSKHLLLSDREDAPLCLYFNLNSICALLSDFLHWVMNNADISSTIIEFELFN